MKLILIFMFLFTIPIVSAELDLSIQSSLEGLNSEFSTKTNSLSTVEFDQYDLPFISPPGEHSIFYSSVDSEKLVIDSWPKNQTPRTLKLIHETSSNILGPLTLSWNFNSDEFEAFLYDNGHDSTHINKISQKIDLEGSGSYTVEINESTRYFSLTILEKAILEEDDNDDEDDNPKKNKKKNNQDSPSIILPANNQETNTQSALQGKITLTSSIEENFPITLFLLSLTLLLIILLVLLFRN